MLEKGSAAAKLRQTEPVAINKSNSQYPEIAVLGRSNAGKSSLVNLLTWRSNLAPVSNTPGKTQQPNRFAMHRVKGSTWLLVDLPGYGFAKVPSGVSNK
jgi:GTP-binding protein